ncbi:unnamed protein product, partial [Protopolystoma xenopodis]
MVSPPRRLVHVPVALGQRNSRLSSSSGRPRLDSFICLFLSVSLCLSLLLCHTRFASVSAHQPATAHPSLSLFLDHPRDVSSLRLTDLFLSALFHILPICLSACMYECMCVSVHFTAHPFIAFSAWKRHLIDHNLFFFIPSLTQHPLEHTTNPPPPFFYTLLLPDCLPVGLFAYFLVISFVPSSTLFPPRSSVLRHSPFSILRPIDGPTSFRPALVCSSSLPCSALSCPVLSCPVLSCPVLS